MVRYGNLWRGDCDSDEIIVDSHVAVAGVISGMVRRMQLVL